jgi:hypothetical protein
MTLDEIIDRHQRRWVKLNETWMPEDEADMAVSVACSVVGRVFHTGGITWDGYTLTPEDVRRLREGADPQTIGPAGCAQQWWPIDAPKSDTLQLTPEQSEAVLRGEAIAVEMPCRLASHQSPQ